MQQPGKGATSEWAVDELTEMRIDLVPTAIRAADIQADGDLARPARSFTLPASFRFHSAFPFSPGSTVMRIAHPPETGRKSTHNGCAHFVRG